MAIKDKDGNWIDAKGRPVPLAHIDQYQRKSDTLVTRIMRSTHKQKLQLAKHKQLTLEQVVALREWAAEQAGVKLSQHGGYVITDFARLNKVEIKVQAYMELDGRVENAVALLYELVEEESKKSDSNIMRAIVDGLFHVDRGREKLDVKRAIELKQHKVKDPSGRWKKAMDIINDSLQVVGRKAHVLYYSREHSEAEWQSVVLNINRS